MRFLILIIINYYFIISITEDKFDKFDKISIAMQIAIALSFFVISIFGYFIQGWLRYKARMFLPNINNTIIGLIYLGSLVFLTSGVGSMINILFSGKYNYSYELLLSAGLGCLHGINFSILTEQKTSNPK